jgi:hypothetical protein
VARLFLIGTTPDGVLLLGACASQACIIDLVVTDIIGLFANARCPRVTVGAQSLIMIRGAASITCRVQCGVSYIIFEAARCGQRATIIRNIIRLLRVDTLDACVAMAIGTNRVAIRADADGVITVGFLIHATIRSRVDTSNWELNALGTSEPQVRSIQSSATTDTYPPVAY